MWTAETSHDPFLPHVLAAEHTSTIELGTSIAVAFARSPMLLANIGWDLQAYSKGRFVLGLGSQIKPHIEKRFSMPWSKPAARMRELIQAIRAIWACWEDGTKLDFRGEFYRHTLMTPFFTPNAAELQPFGPPKIFLAGVGELMTEVAGEVCDGFICHGFTTERYLREVTLPALERGRAKAGKTMDGFEIVGPSFVVTGLRRGRRWRPPPPAPASRSRSTARPLRTVRCSISTAGAGCRSELNTLSKQGKWVEMGDADRRRDPQHLRGRRRARGRSPRSCGRRYGDVIQRMSLYTPYASEPDRWRGVLDALKAI